MMAQKMRQHLGVMVALGIGFVAYGGLVQMQWRYGTLRDAHVPETILWYTPAFVGYLGTVAWVEKRPFPMRWVWGAAILFRLMLLFTTPTLSDDVYRYLWDGYVANEGVSPYTYAIDAPELDYLDIPQRAQANNAWMASPYLPAAQMVFWGITAVFPLRPLFLQIAMILFDLGSAWLLAGLLAHARLPAHRLTLYLLNPLVIIEIAHSAHLDAWMILLTLAAIYFTLHTSHFIIHYSLPPFFLALATLTKIIPALIFPIFFWRWTWRQRILYGVLVVGLLVPFGVQAGWGLSGDLDGTGLFGALRIYSNQWNFNSGLFHWLEQFLQKCSVAEPTSTAKLVIAACMLLLLAVVFVQARKRVDVRGMLRLTAVPFIGYTLLTPTLHPWYILILLAFVPFLPPGSDESGRRWLATLPWLYLSWALIFSYLTYLDPFNFGELEWVRRLEWVPTLVLLGTAVFAHLARLMRKPTVSIGQNLIDKKR
ncbi:MAG: hypothetical protein KC421_04510 [Anaerolineales bacterium]|nr:hypothetical protein [Anaerolineales bacterium]